ncbi:MAG: hypothetical protein F2520_06985 [Actinobacteria bacterium]|uniref:Unannotated protein n=1 Tax=freshwater metagenome TaxID=449393 RepID=A0A6J7IRK8_9ZZZZ|nr:hypothetical protein [Actinomycetota bacterium]MTA77988.1 hypothetical protein [Actinomycetota bacterium]
MARTSRLRGLELALGLLIVELLDVFASWQIQAGDVFTQTTGELLFGVDLITTIVFILMAVALVVSTMRDDDSKVNRYAFVYLLMATVQVTLNVVLMVASGHTRNDSLLWGLWDLGAAYLLIVVVFTGWYWWCDRVIDGGAFVFPTRESATEHRPNVVDYLFIAFNTNSTFGPTSEDVVARRVKALMMYQTVLSLSILLVFVARIVGLAA